MNTYINSDTPTQRIEATDDLNPRRPATVTTKQKMKQQQLRYSGYHCLNRQVFTQLDSAIGVIQGVMVDDLL